MIVWAKTRLQQKKKEYFPNFDGALSHFSKLANTRFEQGGYYEAVIQDSNHGNSLILSTFFLLIFDRALLTKN